MSVEPAHGAHELCALGGPGHEEIVEGEGDGSVAVFAVFHNEGLYGGGAVLRLRDSCRTAESVGMVGLRESALGK